MTVQDYERRREALIRAFSEARAQRQAIGLSKSTSNLFRPRDQAHSARLNVRDFHHVLHVDPERRIADVEGMTPYNRFAAETLKHSLLPAVVPELKTITVGGAVSGIGIESSSFKFGLVHETVEEMEILIGDGRTIVCSRDRNPDLFFGFPNSYGTLGYVLRLTLRLIETKPYVRLTHSRFDNAGAFFAKTAEICESQTGDYLDGTVFSPREMYVTRADFTETAPAVSSYSYLGIYYQSIRRKPEDWLRVRDYIWRWDTDWFWCSRQFYVQNPVVRFLATPRLLNSLTYQRLMRFYQKLKIPSPGWESVIQDVDIPIGHAPDFLEFLLAEIGITPIWICPLRAFNPDCVYPLYALDPQRVYINFGFWDAVPTTHPPGHFNRKVEKKMVELCGKKGLYSSSWFDEETFWRLYNRTAYEDLKRRYDPDHTFQDLYSKCVRTGK